MGEKINIKDIDKKINICEKCGRQTETLFLVETTHYVCGKCKHQLKTI